MRRVSISRYGCISTSVHAFTRRSRQAPYAGHNGSDKSFDLRIQPRLTVAAAVRSASTFVSFQNSLQEPLPEPEHSNLKRRPTIDTPVNTSFADLNTQSNVNQEPFARSTLLVDQKHFRSNVALWLELLEFRHRVYGLQGVKDIFFGLRRRGVQIPTDGTGADTFWKTFLDAAAADTRFCEHLWSFAAEQAQASNQWWDGFYTGLVGRLLKSKPQTVPDWGVRFGALKPALPMKGSLKELIEPAMSSAESLNAFRSIYLQHSDRDIYRALIPELSKRNSYHEALEFHYFLIRNGDLPRTTAEVETLAKHVAVFADQRTLDEFRLSLAKISQTLTAPLTTMTGETTNSLDDGDITDGIAHDTTSKRRSVSDATAARAFATTAFSVNFIITGLLSFGYRVLGLTAMRELAVRCESVIQLSQHLNRMKDEGVIIEDRMYVKLMQRLAVYRNQSLFEAVVQSDLHPDVYDDRELQLRLLEQYKSDRDWIQLHRTLTVLTVLYQDPSEQAWNILLRGYMLGKHWRMVDVIVDDMIAQRINITEQTINKSFFLLLRARNPGKGLMSKTTPDGVDDLAFITRLWLKILRSGGQIPFYSWRQPLTYYGMQGRLGELESLSLDLANFYSTRSQAEFARHPPLQSLSSASVKEKAQTLRRIQRFRPRVPDQSWVNAIFTPAKQRAIVAWGFKTLGKSIPTSSRLSSCSAPDAAAAENAPDLSESKYNPKSQWDRGLRLLMTLQKLGLRLNRWTVRRTVRHRLQILYHPHYVSSKPENRIAQQNVPVSLNTMIRHINLVTNENLLGIPTHLLLDKSPAAQAQLAQTVLEREIPLQSFNRHRLAHPTQIDSLDGMVMQSESGDVAALKAGRVEACEIANDQG